jgi:hypothetical protein
VTEPQVPAGLDPCRYCGGNCATIETASPGHGPFFRLNTDCEKSPSWEDYGYDCKDMTRTEWATYDNLTSAWNRKLGCNSKVPMEAL